MRGADDGLLYEREAARKKLDSVGKVVLIGSGKGGVGKSLVASGLALTLAKSGHRTGILDLDIHGASLPGYFGIAPPLSSTDRGLKPKVKEGLEIMSVALFTGERPVPMRGGEKQNLVNQLFALTDWGPLDFLVVDLPPTTGDEALAAFELFGSKATLILVTTPSPIAVKVVSRLRQLARGEGIPVGGIVVNMAYIGEGKRRKFPFGRPSPGALERQLEAKVLAEVPLDESVNKKRLGVVLSRDGAFSVAFERLAARLSSR